MTLLRIFATCIILWSLTGCNSDPPIAPNDSAFAEPPRITGIVLTDERGQSYGVWGTPNDHRGFSGTVDGFLLGRPYPNPFTGMVIVHFRTDRTGLVSIWAIRGVGPGQTDDLRDFAGPSASPIADLHRPIVIEKDLPCSPGIYTAVWDGRGNDGLPVPYGFYRIYLSINSDLFWVDTYSYDPEHKLEFPNHPDTY